MQSIILIVAAAVGLAMPTIAMPLEGSSALQARGTTNYLLTCATGIVNGGASDASGRALFTNLCIRIFGCAHSEAPSVSASEYIGGCIDCPAGISQSAIGDCVIVAQ
ncbi:uncharacterized protein M421DRAFT_420029 [Didymella exigua CBS 183.55]|uniref:Uncharacterized protein n=1 Tax=Didymella exigua CBS 183.55 TaxID=1150837 RepID=A0A6A5RK64_9PLEO|nr:uncharacterized protein M421DRAFT_420029 [Didymella exigua CBS 183.55]KAF1928801.1 hypothetical protein M421DRAFT_420029 [Didymella exigua CBS 183.55]